MSAEQHDFENLRRLLKLKCYEQPPPRYFNDFSTQVLNGIRNGLPAQRTDVAEELAGGWPWLARLLGAFQSKPMAAGFFGVAVCGLLVAGMTYSDRPQTTTQIGDLVIGQPQPAPLVPSATSFGGETALIASSTNPVIPYSGSLFDVKISTVPVNWLPGGN